MLGLTFKNYYRVLLTWILQIQNLFHNLTTNYAWNNYVSSNVTKFWKLIIGAMNVETRIWKYRYEARNTRFKIIPLYATSDGRRWMTTGGKLSTSSRTKEMALGQAQNKAVGGCPKLFRRGETFRSWRWLQQWRSQSKTRFYVVILVV